MTLKINNISKIINNTKIINNLTLEVKYGEIAIILGRSGAGKSTLLRILNNLDNIDQGEILLDNYSIKNFKEKKIGIVFQNFNLFSNLSVIENIILALTEAKKLSFDMAIEIGLFYLKKYNLLHKKDSPIQKLSGGEKQKIAIIRTLVTTPQVICFDEPISALDPYSTNDILNFIKELQKKNYIIIMTTHNIGILNQLDCSIHLLKDGSIVESKYSNDFLNKNNYSLLNQFIEGK